MHLLALRAERVRNLKEIDLRLPQGLTLVAGANGQGKTTLLETVYVLGTGRSFRTRRLEELVAWDGGPLSVVGRVATRHGEVELGVSVDSADKGLLVNGARRGLESFLGRLDVVDLTAARTAVLRGGPVERRRFLDRGVVGAEPSFLRVIGEYRRVLLQRNALLRRGISGRGGTAELDTWDQRFASAAKMLHIQRRRFAESLGAQLKTIGPELLANGQQPRLRYRPSPPELAKVEEDGFDEVFSDRVARCRGRDRELGYTSEGPHRDDLSVELDGIDLRRFGSAGQVRAAMIALKLGKLSLLESQRGEAPLFLMDDFDTDLDDARMEAVAGFLERARCQAVIATSKEHVVSRLEAATLKLRMVDGEARAA